MSFKSVRTRIFAIFVAAALLVPGLATAGLFDLQASGAELDPELVSQLAGAAPGTPMMVFVHGSDIETATRAVRASNMQLVDTFDKVGVAVAIGTPKQIEQVGHEPGVSFLEADKPIDFFMQTSHKATRGQEALDGFSVTSTEPVLNRAGRPKGKQTTTTTISSPGVDGSGVSIAVIDSGVDGTHPMFQRGDESTVSLNLKFMCPTGAVFFTDPAHPGNTVLFACAGPEGDAIEPMWADMTSVNDTDTPSAGGHGTHVAGIAAGVEVGTPEDPFHGAAPGANIISLSVGAVISVYGGTAGLNWVLEHHDNPCEGCPPIKVVNNSWGSGGSYNPNDLRSKLQHALVAEGVTVVWAAGNSGGNGTTATTNPPGRSPVPGVLSVANYNDANTGTRDGGLASTSSRGRKGDPATYPDISAPGSSITSACRLYLAICSSFEDDPNYGTIGGTSMAAPHVAGIVAQLIQAGRESLGRDLDPGEIEDILEDTAYQFTFGGAYEPDEVKDDKGNVVEVRNADHSTSFDKGHGLVDVVGAVSRIREIPFTSAEPTPGLIGRPHIYQGGVIDPFVLGGDYTVVRGEPVGLSLRGLMSNSESLVLTLNPKSFEGSHQITKDGQLVYGPFETDEAADGTAFRTDSDWMVPVDAAPGDYVFETYVTVGGTTYLVATLPFTIS